MNYNYYAEARHLADLLKNERQYDWAFKILGAIEEGVTATEILMMLRWNLGALLSTKVGSADVRDCAQQLYLKIDNVLK